MKLAVVAFDRWLSVDLDVATFRARDMHPPATVNAAASFPVSREDATQHLGRVVTGISSIGVLVVAVADTSTNSSPGLVGQGNRAPHKPRVHGLNDASAGLDFEGRSPDFIVSIADHNCPALKAAMNGRLLNSQPLEDFDQLRGGPNAGQSGERLDVVGDLDLLKTRRDLDQTFGRQGISDRSHRLDREASIVGVRIEADRKETTWVYAVQRQ